MKKILYAVSILFLSISLYGTLSAKTLKFAFDADPVSYDPHEQLSGGTLQMSHWLFDPLVRWKKEGGLTPRLAHKWEQINKTTMRFHLRKGVRFHSGNALTSQDVVWTFNRLKTSADFKALFEPFKEIKIIDNHTFDIVTYKPYGLVLAMATYIFPMDSKFYSGNDENGQSKDLIDKIKLTFAKTNVSGTGPFTLTAREQGVRNEYTRFADYWDKSSPGNVTKMILTPIKNSATRVAAILSGDIDFISPVPPQDFKRIKSNKKINLVTINGGRIITFQVNQERQPAFKDVKVRQAIAYAINNVGIVEKIMKGFGTPAAQQSPPSYVGHDQTLKPRYNLKKARQLMKEAGYENGFSISMMAPNNRYVNDAKIAEATAAMLAKINIKVSLKTMPKAQYWPKFDERAADMMMIGWHSDTEDSANFSEFLTMTPNKTTGYGQYNSGNYSNVEVDKLIIASQSIIDPLKRKVMLQKVERILNEEVAFIPYHWQHLSYAAKSNVNIDPVLNAQNFPYLGDLVIE